MSDGDGQRPGAAPDHEVAVVGGRPAGCSVALFTARYGLDTEPLAGVAAERDPAAVLDALDDGAVRAYAADLDGGVDAGASGGD